MVDARSSNACSTVCARIRVHLFLPELQCAQHLREGCAMDNFLGIDVAMPPLFVGSKRTCDMKFEFVSVLYLDLGGEGVTLSQLAFAGTFR